jgi:hypothetical protein
MINDLLKEKGALKPVAPATRENIGRLPGPGHGEIVFVEFPLHGIRATATQPDHCRTV